MRGYYALRKADDPPSTEDADGLTPIKDDNVAECKTDRIDEPIFNFVDYSMQRATLVTCLCMVLVAAGLVLYFLIQSRVLYVPEEAVWEPRLQPPIAGIEALSAQTWALLPRITELREQYDNSDIVGFIEIPGANIYHPVVQSGNNTFYLYHDLHRNQSRAGSIFLDYENNLYTLTDDSTIIYGHNMRDGSMFSDIRHFHNEEFFRANTHIQLTTPHRQTTWDIFAFFHTTTYFSYLTTNFSNQSEFYEFMLLLQSMSRWQTDIVISPEDQILILSTCGVQGGANRYVVAARLRA